MKQWYLFYYQENIKLQQSVAELGIEKLHQAGGETENLKLQQPVGEFPSPFACVPSFPSFSQIIAKFKKNQRFLCDYLVISIFFCNFAR